MHGANGILATRSRDCQLAVSRSWTPNAVELITYEGTPNFQMIPERVLPFASLISGKNEPIQLECKMMNLAFNSQLLVAKESAIVLGRSPRSYRSESRGISGSSRYKVDPEWIGIFAGSSWQFASDCSKSFTINSFTKGENLFNAVPVVLKLFILCS